MRRSPPKLWPAAAALVVACGLLVAGCGGGAGSTGSTAAHPSKKATAPNAPAGSKVVTCEENAKDMTELRASEVDCGAARRTMRKWRGTGACALAKGAARGSCSIGDFRCQTVRSGGGASVACARAGGDVTFIAKEWSAKKGRSR